MTLSVEDNNMLQELCEQHQISFEIITKLLDTIREYEFKERRIGVYDALKEIIKSGPIKTGDT